MAAVMLYSHNFSGDFDPWIDPWKPVEQPDKDLNFIDISILIAQ